MDWYPQTPLMPFSSERPSKYNLCLICFSTQSTPCTEIHVYIYIKLCICIYICIYVYFYIDICIYVDIYIYISIYIQVFPVGYSLLAIAVASEACAGRTWRRSGSGQRRACRSTGRGRARPAAVHLTGRQTTGNRQYNTLYRAVFNTLFNTNRPY